jgi:hypothetical protein
MNTGHINIHKRDHDSVITGYGQHDRVVAFQPSTEGLYCRVDHKWGLGEPTVDQILTVARKDQGVKGKWRVKSAVRFGHQSSPYGESTEYLFERA